MSARVLQRARARQDILEIISYVASGNPSAAVTLYEAYVRTLERWRKRQRSGGVTRQAILS